MSSQPDIPSPGCMHKLWTCCSPAKNPSGPIPHTSRAAGARTASSGSFLRATALIASLRLLSTLQNAANRGQPRSCRCVGTTTLD